MLTVISEGDRRVIRQINRGNYLVIISDGHPLHAWKRLQGNPQRPQDVVVEPFSGFNPKVMLSDMILKFWPIPETLKSTSGSLNLLRVWKIALFLIFISFLFFISNPQKNQMPPPQKSRASLETQNMGVWIRFKKIIPPAGVTVLETFCGTINNILTKGRH